MRIKLFIKGLLTVTRYSVCIWTSCGQVYIEAHGITTRKADNFQCLASHVVNLEVQGLVEIKNTPYKHSAFYYILLGFR